MSSILSEVDEHAMHEKGLADGPSNPMSQHAYDGFAKRPSRPGRGPGSGLALGAAAIGLALVLASVFGLWILRSVRRLNRQVAHLNRQTEQLNRRLQSAEEQAKALDQKAAQAFSTQLAALPPEQPKPSEATPAAQTQAPVPSEAAAQPVHQAATRQAPIPQAPNRQAPTKAEESRKQRDAELQKLQQSLGQIAETHRSESGVVTTLGEKSLRFAADKSDIAPQYRAVLNRIAGVLKPIKGDSIYVYGYTDENGSRDYNLKLSARRARSVRDALVKAGIDPALITTKGFGKSKPRVRGSDAKAHAANRRMEIGIVDSNLQASDQPVSSKAAAIR
jgi:outer membrane protein OmpA-like peptidoglycan-associated protein